MKLPDEARIAGPDFRPESAGLAAAIYAHRYAEKRPPIEGDAPPLSTFPMTNAAREALRLSRRRKPPRR